MARSPRLVKKAYDYLLQQIVSLRLKPGDFVFETQVSKELDISRTPVREAMIRLRQEGLLTQDASRRTIVTPLTETNVREPFELREAIEGMAARLAAERHGTPAVVAGIAELEAVRALTARAIEENDPNEYYVQNWTFHEKLVALSGNSLLLEAFSRVRAHLSRVDYLSFVTSAYPQAAVADDPEHLAIVEAIKKGQAGEAEALARAHIVDTRVRLLETIRRLNFRDISPLDWVRVSPAGDDPAVD